MDTSTASKADLYEEHRRLDAEIQRLQSEKKPFHDRICELEQEEDLLNAGPAHLKQGVG